MKLDFGMKHDDGKPDFSLIPWDVVTPLGVIVPIYDWWRRRLNAEQLMLRCRAEWLFRDRDLVLDANASLLYGATKYTPWNWENGIAASRLYKAACRHYVAMIRNPDARDPESGLLHWEHLAFYPVAISKALPDDRP